MNNLKKFETYIDDNYIGDDDLRIGQSKIKWVDKNNQEHDVESMGSKYAKNIIIMLLNDRLPENNINFKHYSKNQWLHYLVDRV